MSCSVNRKSSVGFLTDFSFSPSSQDRSRAVQTNERVPGAVFFLTRPSSHGLRSGACGWPVYIPLIPPGESLSVLRSLCLFGKVHVAVRVRARGIFRLLLEHNQQLSPQRSDILPHPFALGPPDLLFKILRNQRNKQKGISDFLFIFQETLQESAGIAFADLCSGAA